ncbi:uncharacterized protein LOC131892630 [Tigriopus californicus]|uniref:uncharacterized protein LOC131892630 n=1 Tax=Tigriopus californicus TaxID=6832 RepID=UPI0027DA2541|nr:uncharacterized protein LOC131892630 [Tigriopus californicus]
MSDKEDSVVRPPVLEANTGPMVVSEELSKAKKIMSVVKRSITRQLNLLKDAIHSDNLPSRTLLKLKVKEVEATLARLESTVIALDLAELSEEELDWAHTYLDEERDRVQHATARVTDHIESRADEASISFHTGDTQVRLFRQSLKERHQSEQTEALQRVKEAEERVQEAQDTLIQAKAAENMISDALEEIELGSRAGDFVEPLVTENGTLAGVESGGVTSWMANPELYARLGGGSTGHVKSSIDVKMPIFSGNLLEFQEWSNMFEALIHSTNRSPAEKMGLLKASMSDRCKKLRVGFGNSEAHYHSALRTLHKVFGDDQLLVEAHQRELENLPKVRAKDLESLSDFAFTVQGHVLVIQERVPRSDVIWGQLERTLERKLDHDLFRLWETQVGRTKDKNRIDFFCDWLLSMVRSDQRYHGQALVSGKRTVVQDRNRPSHNHSVNLEPQQCILCSKDHPLVECRDFKIMSYDQRMDFTLKSGLCVGCLKPGHMFRRCRMKKRCSKCNRSHHPLLHNSTHRDELANPHIQEDRVSSNSVSNGQKVVLGVIPIKCSGPKGAWIVNALVDEGSDTTFISENILKKLGFVETGTSRTQLTIHGTTATTSLGSYNATIQVGNPETSETFDLEVKSLPVTCKGLKGINWASLRGRWKHLEDLSLSENDGPVHLLLGLDSGHLIEPLEQRRGQKGEPSAFRTRLGWVCRGPINEQASVSQCRHSNFVQDSNLLLDQHLDQFFATESYGAEGRVASETKMSLQDEYALNMIKENTKKLLYKPGYEVSLPWIPGVSRPENNRQLAEKRLAGLERRFIRNPIFATAYRESMGKTIEKGYAVKISNPRELDHPCQAFLPHHGVWKKNKKDVRVVMDSAAQFKGKSLNDCLMSGPPLQNDLMDVLLRFREGSTAVTGDIEAMFSRIYMHEDDGRYHRFLWRSNIDDPIETFQMSGVVFGDKSSPCLAIHTLLQTAEDTPCREVMLEDNGGGDSSIDLRQNQSISQETHDHPKTRTPSSSVGFSIG